MKSEAIDTQRNSSLIADRYRAETILGRGGMGVVYLVTDIVTDRKLALKQLRIKQHDAKQKAISELFEQEYYTLSQLAHPRIVAVYDFGKTDDTLYYTMELLDGGDLRTLSPLPWKKACSIVCDICSALSLLHSRRFVHRDLTPRNIRCTKDSQAKLIDFGSMGLMGVCKHLIGTPAFTAPEVVAMQMLDARADLFSLGATLYYALTGRKVYPVKRFREIRSAWSQKPQPPSEFDNSIPRELDALVLSLISLDAMARPMSAAEVVEKLSAIASLEIDDQLPVSQSYLLKPTLIGRKAEIIHVRKKLIRALCGKGSTIVVKSAPGTGRSRFLDDCVLEGKLSGATVIRVDASDAHKGDWGAVRTMAAQLLDELPEVAVDAIVPHYPVLDRVIPELSASPQDDSVSTSVDIDTEDLFREPTRFSKRAQGADPNGSQAEIYFNKRPSLPTARSLPPLERNQELIELRPRVHMALGDWLSSISERRCLIIAVDDFHRIDEPSAAFIALLANHISNRMVTVIATLDSNAPLSSATDLLVEAGSDIELNNLDAKNTLRLLTSIFGEVPQIQLLSDRLYKISNGNPRAIMQFAQYLVDERIIEYRAGTWTLPLEINMREIPRSLAEALKVQIEKLSDDALKLAQAFSLSAQQSFAIEECSVLLGSTDKAKVLKVLNALQSSGLISSDGHRFALCQPGWVSTFLDGIDPARKSALHLVLADVYSRRHNQSCRVAKHLFKAGEDERGLDALLSGIEEKKQQIEEDARAYSEFVMSLPVDWADIYERAVDVCKELGRPRKQRYLLQIIMTRIGDQTGLTNTRPVIEVVDQLVHDSGLAIYRELDDSVEADKRIWRALELTQSRYDACAEYDRVLAPAEAIPDLAKTLANVIGMTATSYDYDLLDAMPSIEPLIPLSPAIGIINQSARSTLNSLSGRLELSLQGLQGILRRIAEPDRAGLDETVHKFIDLGHRWGIGVIESSLGLKSSLQWADEIATHPLHEVNAWRIRMVYYLRQGDIQEAEACKKKMGLLQIQNSPTQFYEGVYQYGELVSYVLADDLVRVKRLIPGLGRMAKLYPDWEPVYLLAQGEYQRIRGDYDCALIELDRALGLTKPGRNMVWPTLIGSYIKTLYELGRLEDAKRFGEKHLAIATEMGFQYSANSIRLPLSLVQSHMGEFDNAIRNCETVIENYQAIGSTGMGLGIAYETRASIAILMKDTESFDIYANLCSEQFRAGNYPALIAKYEKLMQKACYYQLEQANIAVCAPEDVKRRAKPSVTEEIATLIKKCRNRQERFQRVLIYLINKSKSSSGYLYTMQDGIPKLSAQIGDCPPSELFDDWIVDYVTLEMNCLSDAMLTLADFATQSQSQSAGPKLSDRKYHRLILSHEMETGSCLTGLVLLFTDSDQPFSLSDELATQLSECLSERVRHR